MKYSQLHYLFSIILFCGPVFLLALRRHERLLKKSELIFLILIAISIPYAGLADYVALHTGAWFYSAHGSFDIQFGAELESYLFVMALIVVYGSTTIVLANRIDRKSSRKIRRTPRRSKS
jgi:lycopene cyclase domain-containing protein